MWVKELLFGKGKREEKAYSELLTRYDAYLRLLRAHNGLLEAFADLESMAGSGELYGWERLRNTVLRTDTQAAIMAKMLQGLSSGAHTELLPLLEDLAAAVRARLGPPPVAPPPAPLVVEKPDTGGFALTPGAFREYLRHNDVEEMARIFWDTLDPADPHFVGEVARTLQGAAAAGQMPAGLADAVRNATDKLRESPPSDGLYTVFSRSACVRKAVAGVPLDSVPEACREVFASYFGEEAVALRLRRGYGALEEEMAVAIVPSGGYAFASAAASGGEGPGPAPVREALKEILPLVIQPGDDTAADRDLCVEDCKTLHDVVRFMHARALDSIATLPELIEKGAERQGIRIREWLPVDFRIVPLASGIAEGAKGGVVSVEEVTSAPAAALLRGLMDESLHVPGQRLADMQGFLSVMSGSLIATTEISLPSWAIVSDRYLQFSTRVGYHFTELEAYAGPRERDNRVRFVFKGGAGEEPERRLRALFVARVLDGLGFGTRQKGDFVTGVLGQAPAERIEAVVAQVGRLIVCASQPELVISGATGVESLAAAFLEGDYSRVLRIEA